MWRAVATKSTMGSFVAVTVLVAFESVTACLCALTFITINNKNDALSPDEQFIAIHSARPNSLPSTNAGFFKRIRAALLH